MANSCDKRGAQSVTNSVSRREALQQAATWSLFGAAWSAGGASLLGCNVSGNRGQLGQASPTRMVSDIRVIALYSTGEKGPETGIIRAVDIIALRAVTLPHWDSHGHVYTVTPEVHRAILDGRTSRIRTTIALNHDHDVLVDPAYAVPGTAIPLPDSGSSPQPSPQVSPSPQPQDPLFARLDEQDQLAIAMKSETGLTPEVSYCLDTLDACRRDPNLWKRMVQDMSRQDRMIFLGQDALALDPSTLEHTVMVRAKLLAQDPQGMSVVRRLVERIVKVQKR